jgi:predicted RNA-binding Zn ribbon-like protein
VSSPSRQSEYQFDLSGGNLALDFANTVSHRSVPERRAEHLGTYLELIAFARQSKLISQSEDAELRRIARTHHAEAACVLRKALLFREAVYRAFARAAFGKSVAPADLEHINQFSADAMSRRKVTRTNGSYRWDWSVDKSSQLERPLWPIAQAAAELLTSEDMSSIRECEADDCEWLFLDNSRNHSRRWCEMKSCGNRAKARRHYERTHAE